MTARRFTDKPDLDPQAVRSLPAGHPALVGNRTLFPSTVVDVDESFEGNLLVSGKNNRKLGETIAKGKFKGFALYGLSLEERATCPVDCAARAYCYGNGMQMARRHRIGDLDYFFITIEDEIRTILQSSDGLMVRLHVLGDFPSVEYVAGWADLLAEHPTLACFGYTRRLPKKDPIGDAIEAVKAQYPDRFRIRWSAERSLPDGATVISRIPDKPRIAEGLVCPAQTDDTACCASCGLCWEGAAKKDTIVFIKHGPKSLSVSAEAEKLAPSSDGLRPIKAIDLPKSIVPAPLTSATPELRMVPPQSLKIEATYQRDLSGRSITLIRKIVSGWDWSKFKPPVCAETDHGLVVIDGQHTAIGAATHPSISVIPVLVVAEKHLDRRAAAFVSHNMDRVAMTPQQVFYGKVAAGDPVARAILAAANKAGATIPRYQVPRASFKAGQVSAFGTMYDLHSAGVLERALGIAVKSGIIPISMAAMRGLRVLFTDPAYADVARAADSRIATALGSFKNIDFDARNEAMRSGESRLRACAALIARVVRKPLVRAA